MDTVLHEAYPNHMNPQELNLEELDLKYGETLMKAHSGNTSRCPGEGYRQVEPGTRLGANQQHYSRRANEQRRENERRFLRNVQSEVGRDNGYPQVSRSYQVDGREPRDTRMDLNTNARAPIPDMWTATPEARGWMDNVQRELNLRGYHTRFPGGSFSGRRFQQR